MTYLQKGTGLPSTWSEKTNVENTVRFISAQEAGADGVNDTFRVGNTPGAALPNIGGPGTRLFTILGSILFLGAGVLLLKRRRLV